MTAKVEKMKTLILTQQEAKELQEYRGIIIFRKGLEIIIELPYYAKNNVEYAKITIVNPYECIKVRKDK